VAATCPAALQPTNASPPDLRSTPTGFETLGRYDSVWLDPREPHRVENSGDERAVGLDVFVPGRSFDFWTDGE
jgi:hypothetical protein